MSKNFGQSIRLSVAPRRAPYFHLTIKPVILASEAGIKVQDDIASCPLFGTNRNLRTGRQDMVERMEVAMERLVYIFSRFVFVLFLSAMSVTAFADEPEKQRVLLLYYDNQGNMSNLVESFDKGLRSAFMEQESRQIDLTVEYTDLSGHPSKTYENQLLDLFKTKYAESPPDLIIANMNPYSSFLARLCDDLFPETEIIFSFYDASFLDVLDRFPGRSAGVYVESGREDTPNLIERLLPRTKNIVFIGGATEVEKNTIQRLVAMFKAHEDRFNITYLIGTPVAEILDIVGNLPEDAIIYFTTYNGDRNGNIDLSHNVLSLLSDRAHVPIFSFNDAYLGYGLLGGELTSSEEIGKTVAQMALRVLGGEAPGDIEPVKMTGQYIFNWQQLQKWGIDENRLPAESIIKNREYTFFEKYKRRIIFWAGVTLLQFCLITYLIITLVLWKRSERERTRLESALRQSQKMEAIGTLAGGIAHDFNNILSAIIGFTELTLMETEKGSQAESNLQMVLKGSLRARDLVSHILAFARKSMEETSLIRIRPIAQDVLKLLQSTVPSSIEIKTNFTSDSKIMANTARIHQIFLNICNNAVEAMKGQSGTISVDVSDVTLTGDDILRPGKYVKIWISDTGPGIPEAHLEQIFDPYFTTKEFGEGSGLGLSVVLGVVEGYGGRVKVDSKLNHGTTFTVYLPASTPGIKA
jgi:signal transduction histidine kinase